MKKILLSLLILASLSAHAQLPDPPEKIADETTMEVTRNNAKMKIVTSNATISKKLIDRYTKCQCITYSFKFKKDRNGTYPEWTIHIPIDHKQDVLDLVK